MPFVEGVPFDSLIDERNAKNKPFSQDELLGLATRILDALGYLHDRAIYHRDLKPGNILITDDGVPVLIDFGSARQLLSERSLTVIESPGYTPFEQLQSRGNVGPWSDLYALGATLARAITAETPPKAADRMMGDPWQGLAADLWTATYADWFLQSIDRAMAVDPAHRWQSAREWRDFFNDGAVSTVESVRRNAPSPILAHSQTLSAAANPMHAVQTSNPYQPPVTVEFSIKPIRVEKKHVILHEGYQLPTSHCICCGNLSTKQLKRNFGYTPWGIWVAAIAPIILGILYLCLHKNRSLSFGLCAEHAKSNLMKQWICYSTGILFALFVVLAANTRSESVSEFLAILGFLLFLTWVVLCQIPRPMKIVALKDGYIKLAGISTPFKNLLNQ
jgi:serine/threonine protein kinase